MIITVTCPICHETFTETVISVAMEALRFHREQRHLGPEIETDT